MGKQLVFTEVGYASHSNTARTPWDYTAGAHPDFGLQQRCFRAFINTWDDVPELAGTYLWIWEPDKGGKDDFGYSWRGKPSETVIAAWYGDL